MSAHTPGPWTVKWCTDADWTDKQIHCDGIEGPDGIEIVTTDGGVYGPNEADARLIGAAPDLLNQLLFLRQTIHQAHHEGPLEGCRVATCVSTSAVIAKATGGEP